MTPRDQDLPNCILKVRVTPRSSRPGLADWRNGVLSVRVGCAPESGKANRELARLVADVVGVPPSCVEVIAGTSRRDKRLRIIGLTQEQLENRLGQLRDRGA